MSTAEFSFTSTVVPVDALPVNIVVTVTPPAGAPAITNVSAPVGSATITIPGLTVPGTYSYTVYTEDSTGAQVKNVGVAYPPVTGTFVVPAVQLTGEVVTSVTVTLS